jgi:hypothetical protein
MNNKLTDKQIKAIISELQTIRAHGKSLAEMAGALIEKLQPVEPKKRKGLTDEQRAALLARCNKRFTSQH